MQNHLVASKEEGHPNTDPRYYNPSSGDPQKSVTPNFGNHPPSSCICTLIGQGDTEEFDAKLHTAAQPQNLPHASLVQDFGFWIHSSFSLLLWGVLLKLRIREKVPL